jgi:hypothetical protein
VSCSNLESVSKTLARKIWLGIKDDEQIKAIIENPRQISHLPPKDTKEKSTQVSVFLYNITELTSMRNQPQTQNPKQPHTLMYLNLRYLITPLTQSVESDQVVLGKIMQLFAQSPVIRGTELQGSLSEVGVDLRVSLDALGIDDLNKLWTMLSVPYKLCISYSVSPVPVQSPIVETKPEIIKKEVTVGKIIRA